MAKNLRPEVDAAVEELGDITKYGVNFETTHGPIHLELWPDVAPGHVKNILGLTKIGFYSDIEVHRIIPGFVVQAGCPEGTGTGGPGYTIDAEFNGRDHVTGVLSMARTNQPNTAGSQFFICLDRCASLDNQYTAFGKCRDEESLSTIAKMAEVPTDRNDHPTEPVVILSGTVVEL